MAGEVAEAYAFGQNDFLVGYYAFKEKDKSLRLVKQPQ